MRRRSEALPDGGLMFNGKRYATQAEYEQARERQQARRARWLALLGWESVGDETGRMRKRD